MAPIRVLVVDDSLTVRQHLMAVLATDPELEVVGEAGDGHEAISLCQTLRPQVVTLDMALPTLSGLDATEQIMAYCPTPIIIVSASTNRGDVFRTYDALAAGAIEVLEKPLGLPGCDDWDLRFLRLVKLAARIKVITHPRARLAPVRAVARPVGRRQSRRLIAIGASTGGPGAVLAILRQLPAGFPVPVLLTIHISPAFGPFLADWLTQQTPHTVRLAEDDQPLRADGTSQFLLAPPDHHLVVEAGRARLSAAPERHSCRPSVDVLFESVAVACGPEAIGCLLTGMGRDGALGLQAIRAAGGRTIAQDEATSIVAGMPQEAVRLGAAEQVLSLDAIAPALMAITASEA